MSRLTNDMRRFSRWSASRWSGGARVLLIVWLTYTMLNRSVPFALISMATVPVMALATVWFSTSAQGVPPGPARIGGVNADLQENIAGFARRRPSPARTRTSALPPVQRRQPRRQHQGGGFTSALMPALEALGYISIVIVAGVGGILMLRQQDLFGTVISLGLIVTFLSYTQQFNQPIQMIATLWTNVQSAIAGIERIFEFLDEVPDVVDKPGAVEMPPIEGRVELRDVWMSYNEDENVLCGVSLTAEPGQTIAIVGPTGAGKTTIINLLPRFYDVDGGAVLIDGYDVRDVTADSLRRQIGIVLQDTFLFSDTVMNNIRYGRPDATDEDVIAAAQLAHADSFITACRTVTRPCSASAAAA